MWGPDGVWSEKIYYSIHKVYKADNKHLVEYGAQKGSENRKHFAQGSNLVEYGDQAGSADTKHFSQYLFDIGNNDPQIIQLLS